MSWFTRSKSSQDRTTDVSEAEIAVHWQEENYVKPPEKFVAQANLTDKTVLERFSLENFPGCFKEYADLLDWYKPWDVTLDTSNPPFWRWFVGGRINASYNCVDRHLAKPKNKTAIHFVPESEQEAIQHITYQELYVRVNEVAALLRDFCGLKKGDRVTLHMPMVAELPITMLACARLGVIHSQVFSGFSGKATADRIVDAESHVLITMDGYYRGGQLLDHKEKADIAVNDAKKEGMRVDKVLVWQRHPGRYSSPTPLVEGRDVVVNEVLSGYRRRRIDPVQMPAEDPLFLMYTSGTTGRPKGCQHSTGGYLSYVAGTSKYIQDIHPEDVYWCMADIGWITGHSYIVYGPLALAASSVVYEGLPTYPDAGPVAHRRRARRQHLSHLADSDTGAAPGRARRAAQIQSPLQAHDDSGRAHRAGGVEVVLRRRGQGRGGHRRHLVANRERRFPVQHDAGPSPHETGKRGAGRAWHSSDHL
jgi:acetyl-CoA synthetase